MQQARREMWIWTQATFVRNRQGYNFAGGNLRLDAGWHGVVWAVSCGGNLKVKERRRRRRIQPYLRRLWEHLQADGKDPRFAGG